MFPFLPIFSIPFRRLKFYGILSGDIYTKASRFGADNATAFVLA